LGIAFYIDMTHYVKNPIQDSSIEKTIEILPGEQFETTLDHLMVSGIVKSPLRFRLLARFKGYDKHIKVGEYRVSTQMSPEEILEALVSGRSVLYRFTIPEGYNLYQIAEVIEQNGWGSREKFLLLTNDPEFTQSLGIEAQTLEGYLFPETYFFPKNINLKKIITAMADRFHKVFSDQWGKRAEEIGLTVHQVVTLASIIEKETGDVSERPIISSVFHNRLKKRMRLESDPTVIYGIKNFNGNITRKDLNTPTPYNTYKIKGLPPGPIASPGEKSIEAVLYPAGTKFIFFVSKKNGTHHFSRTLSEHRKAVRKYQLSR
jgi:UPF0755 protein